MTALQRKLLRELWQMRMQMLSIALVVATGVMTVVTMRGSYVSLIEAQSNYYLQARFADVWAPLVRAPLAITERLLRIPGVAVADPRITLLATLDLPGVDRPAQGLFMSLPAFGRPRLNDILIGQGRYIQPGAHEEVVISRKFAEARGLGPGASIRVVINGRSQKLRIVGVASSPEHAYAVPPGSILPEYDRFGVFWVNEEFLGPAYDMSGAFNEVVLALDPGANLQAVLQQVDAVLEPYGGLGSYPRADQLSHLILDNELDEIRVMGTVIPGIFLGVAIFLLHQVLERLITTQRGEIAVLKAFGYSDRETGWHFLSFALVGVAAGALGGSIGGIYLGEGLVNMYGAYFEVPGLQYRLTPSLLVLAIGLTLAGACSGALTAVMKAARLPPAEAMRPETPARFKPGPLEAIGLGRLLPASGKMVLRNLERQPLHAVMSVIGVALAMAMLVVGMFMFDSITYVMDLQFRQIQREDVALVFNDEVQESVRHELVRLPGVSRVETWRGAPARLRAGHLEDELVITALEPDSLLRRLVNTQGEFVPLPSVGIVVSARLAENLHITTGDLLALEWLDGKRLHATVQVTGITEDFLGLSAWMSKTDMNALSGSSDLVSGAYLLTSGDDDSALYRELKQIPGITSVSSPQEMLAVFDEEMARSLTLTSSFLLGFASVLAFGVIYNSARIALSERGRELASLRVMGFHREEVSTLLLGEQAVITLLALPLGSAIGYWLAHAIAASIASDSYRIPFVADPRTFVLAGLVIVTAAVFSMFAVRRRLDRMELVSVLKTRE
jgi:putative ABC transport system permease protein